MQYVCSDPVSCVGRQWLFDIREMELAIAAGRTTGLPVVACMTIGTKGDHNGVTPEECAVRMARAGADVGESSFRVSPGAQFCPIFFRCQAGAYEYEPVSMHRWLLGPF